MSNGASTLIAIGGGELEKSQDVLDKFLSLIKKAKDARLVVMTIATSEPESAADKYNRLFRKNGVEHVSIVDVSQRDDSFKELSLKKVREADGLFFTGGDQLNITSLLGGSTLHNAIYERIKDGIVLAGTSAGAAMMSNSMIVSGRSDTSPKVGGVEIAPGMDLLSSTIIDTHFSERGRHGRLLTAIAHYPQDLGIGIDEQTAIVVRGSEFKVLGKGVVTIMDGSQMRHNNLPYRRDDETVGLFGVDIHVLPAGYKYDLKKRVPIAPEMGKMAGANDEV